MPVLQHFLFRRLIASSHLSGSKRKKDRKKRRRTGSADSLLGVLSLGIDGGTTIKVIAAGPDEEQAVDELVKLVNSGFAV